MEQLRDFKTARRVSEGLYVLALNFFLCHPDSNFPEGQSEPRQNYISGWILCLAWTKWLKHCAHPVAVWSRFTGHENVRCGHGLSRHSDLYGLGGQWRSATRCLASQSS